MVNGMVCGTMVQVYDGLGINLLDGPIMVNEWLTNGEVMV